MLARNGPLGASVLKGVPLGAQRSGMVLGKLHGQKDILSLPHPRHRDPSPGGVVIALREGQGGKEHGGNIPPLPE